MTEVEGCGVSAGVAFLPLWVPRLRGGPFRSLEQDCHMTELKPYEFYSFGYYIQPLLYLRADLPYDVKIHLLTYAQIGLTLFTSDPHFADLLPQTRETAKMLMEEINIWNGLKQDAFSPRTADNIPGLHDWVKNLSTTMEKELERLHVYCVADSGSLSASQLVLGATAGYPSVTTSLFDKGIRQEVDEAGRCLAFGRWTACGFHILRSIEIIIKGYLVAATGPLPPLSRRNWGEYIQQLEKAGASQAVVDVLHVLKRMRNPLMHPQDNLEEHEAIDVFNICRAAANVLVAEIRAQSLEQKFADALPLLPTLGVVP